MSVHLRWTKDGARRYDVRLRDPSGTTYTRNFRTRREAEAFESDERASRRRGNWLDPRRSEVPLRVVAGRWLDSNPAKRPSSRARDDSALRVHIFPALGDRSVGSLTPSDIQRCVNEWSERLAPRSVRRVYQTLSAVLNAAVLDDRIARSPCRGIRLPAIQPTDRPVLTSDQLASLAKAQGLSLGRWSISGLCSGFVGASAPVSVSAASTSTGRPSPSPSRSPEASEGDRSSDHPSSGPPAEPWQHHPPSWNYSQPISSCVG